MPRTDATPRRGECDYCGQAHWTGDCEPILERVAEAHAQGRAEAIRDVRAAVEACRPFDRAALLDALDGLEGGA